MMHRPPSLAWSGGCASLAARAGESLERVERHTPLAGFGPAQKGFQMFDIASLLELREADLLSTNGGRHGHILTLPGGLVGPLPYPGIPLPPSPPGAPLPPPPGVINPGGPMIP